MFLGLRNLRVIPVDKNMWDRQFKNQPTLSCYSEVYQMTSPAVNKVLYSVLSDSF